MKKDVIWPRKVNPCVLSRVDLHLPDLDFFTPYGPFVSGWIHIVVNYIGTNNGQGIILYYNGQEVASDTNKHGGPSSAGDGRIVV